MKGVERPSIGIIITFALVFAFIAILILFFMSTGITSPYAQCPNSFDIIKLVICQSIEKIGFGGPCTC